jgi:O-antigen ligase
VRARLLLEAQLSNPNNTLVSRWHLWRGALHLLREHPLTGVGIAAFQPHYLACCLYGDPPSRAVMYPHNLLLNTWVETGLLGVVALAWLAWRAAKLLAPLWRSQRDRWLGVGLAGAGLYTLVHGFIDVPLMKNDLAAEAALLLALAVGASAAAAVPAALPPATGSEAAMGPAQARP